jgi:hypothetical protein
MTSGTVAVSALALPAGLAVNNITLQVGSTAFTGVTHGWYALLDSGMVIRAISADQAGGNWASGFAQVGLSVASASYVTTYSGLYYIAFCAVFTGSGTFPAINATVGNAAGYTPALSGTSSTGQTTPPATGTTLAAVSYLAGGRFYAFTS